MSSATRRAHDVLNVLEYTSDELREEPRMMLKLVLGIMLCQQKELRSGSQRRAVSAAEEVVDMRGGWADPDLFL